MLNIEYSKGAISLEVLRRILYNPRDLSRLESLNENSGNIMVHCPIHGVDKNPSCSINISKGIYNCFACGSSGTLSDLYYKLTGRSIRRELNIGPAEPLTAWTRPKHIAPTISYDKLPDTHFTFVENSVVPVYDNPSAKQYVEKRGFTPFVVQSMGMKYAISAYAEDNLTGKKIYYNNRLLIPVYEQGKLLTVEGRDVMGEDFWKKRMQASDKEFEYRKCIYPTGSSSNTLYDYANLNPKKTLYFTEGIMDVAAMRTSSRLRNSTSTFGCKITERQYYLLKKFDDIVYIVNNDKAGWLSLHKMKKNFNKPFRVLVPIEGAKDVNDIIMKCHMTIDEVIDKNWLSYAQPAESFDTKKILLEDYGMAVD